MDKRKIFLKNAGVLLLAIVIIFSSGVAIANSNTKKDNINTTFTTTLKPYSSEVGRAIVWDNVVGVTGSLGGIIVSTVRTEGAAFPADDFILGASQEVDHLFWQGGYFQCQLAEGEKDYHWDWRIIFWDDYGDGSHPGNEIYNITYSDAVITREFWYNYTRPDNNNTYWVANYSVDLQPTYTFAGNTKYWITIQGIQGTNAYPQACWARHNNSVGGIKLHEAVIMAAWWGYPNWVNLSVLVTDHLPHDLNYQLYGPFVNDPPREPTIKGPAKVKSNAEIDYTFNAEDPQSDDVFYYVEWGDGNISEWVGPSGSGVDVILNHTWAEKGKYTIKAKAKDVWEAESDWSSLEITVPRTRSMSNFLYQLLQRFPNIFPILKNLLIK